MDGDFQTLFTAELSWTGLTLFFNDMQFSKITIGEKQIHISWIFYDYVYFEKDQTDA